MAVTAASAVNEEATSTHTEMGTGRAWRPSPSIADGSCTTGKPPVAWRPSGGTLPPLVAPAQKLRSRGGATLNGITGRVRASQDRARRSVASNEAFVSSGHLLSCCLAVAGRGRGMRLIDQVTAQPTHGASLSSFEEADATGQPRSTPNATMHSETPSETQCLALVSEEVGGSFLDCSVKWTALGPKSRTKKGITCVQLKVKPVQQR